MMFLDYLDGASDLQEERDDLAERIREHEKLHDEPWYHGESEYDCSTCESLEESKKS